MDDANVRLARACGESKLEDAERAIREGADVNKPEAYNTTLLMNAAREGRAEIVELLLKHGARVLLKNDFGKTALDYAVMNSYSDIAKALNERADVEKFL